MKRLSSLVIVLSVIGMLAGLSWAEELRCKITVPAAYSIVRGDVPIYGYACGKDFKKYRLEYGEGENPKEWLLINKANKPQEEPETDSKMDLDQAKTIPGNLGMWETGLSEYNYKNENSVDLSIGLYTLRLTAFGKRGKKTEDKIMVEVGRVLLNCHAGGIESRDKKVTLSVPDHSLYKAIEIISIKPLKETIYEINPPGLAFTQKATLFFRFEKQEEVNPRQLNIGEYNPETKEWQLLQSYYNEKENTLETYLDKLPDKFAVYTIFVSTSVSNILHSVNSLNIEPEILNDVLLCCDTFEDDFSQWHNDYGSIGAKVELDDTQYEDGSKCLKLTNQKERGNFAVSIIKEAYDLKKYPIITFDYKIPAEVKINLLAKINNTWYDIVFTDDEKVYWDINMDKIGKIENVQADGQWHTAIFNLGEALKKYYKEKYIKDRDFQVQELCFANWDSTGLAKLEFGHNPQGVSYYIDNFSIRRKEKNL